LAVKELLAGVDLADELLEAGAIARGEPQQLDLLERSEEICLRITR
jgi:hypothetical protein